MGPRGERRRRSLKTPAAVPRAVSPGSLDLPSAARHAAPNKDETVTAPLGAAKRVDEEREDSMAGKIRLTKRSLGGRNSSGLGGDGIMTLTQATEKRAKVLAIRLRSRTLERCRMRPGDRVLIDFESDDRTGVMTLTRTDSEKDGYTISAREKDKSGAVIKASLDEEGQRLFFPNCQRRYVMHMDKGDSKRIVLLVDYTETATTPSKDEATWSDGV